MAEDAETFRRKHSKRTPNFSECWAELPQFVQTSALKSFRIWCEKPDHHALQYHALKSPCEGWYTVKICGKDWLAAHIIRKDEKQEDWYIWDWCGSHSDFDKLFPQD